MTTTRRVIQATVVSLALLAGCSNKSTEPSEATTPPDPLPPPTETERPQLTTAECEAKGGLIVGDIGDGAIHRPDYVCESGQPPFGSIRPEGDEPIATEGSVCCPAAAS